MPKDAVTKSWLYTFAGIVLSVMGALIGVAIALTDHIFGDQIRSYVETMIAVPDRLDSGAERLLAIEGIIEKIPVNYEKLRDDQHDMRDVLIEQSVITRATIHSDGQRLRREIGNFGDAVVMDVNAAQELYIDIVSKLARIEAAVAGRLVEPEE